MTRLKMSRGLPSLSLLVAILATSIVTTTFGANHAFAATEKVLHSFEPFLNGYYPAVAIGDSAGNLYVATQQGGRYSDGVVLKFTPNSQGGFQQSVLYTMKGGTTDGIRPIGLFFDREGNLCGLTALGGSQNDGTFFKLTPTAHGQWSETILYNFGGTNGYVSYGLVEDRSGNFYGTTYNYGPTYGSIFQLVPSAGGFTQNVIHVFSGGSDGGFPYGQLVLDQSGNIYGTTEEGGINNDGLAFEFSPSGSSWTETILHDFLGGTDGSEPASALTFDSAGNLYGTTNTRGSAGCNGSGGCGTVYELQPAGAGTWTKTTLYSFPNKSQTSVSPQDLVFGSDGDLYGTTFEGGGGELCCGTVFKLSFASGQWTEANLYVFSPQIDAYEVNNGIVFGSAGQIYGTTTIGGATGVNGTVFEITPAGSKWKETNLYGFPLSDGGYPYAGLAMDAAGNLYGTTNQYGVNNLGMAYKLSPSAKGIWTETDIYNFTTGIATYGAYPSSLILDSAGNLYGAAEETGTKEDGSVFKLSLGTNGGYSEKDLFDMTGTTDHPSGGLIADNSGNLYGTTQNGGTHGFGAVFELTPQANGAYKQIVLYSFSGYPVDGAIPTAALAFDSAGNLYGTTSEGGPGTSCKGAARNPIGCGTVFELQPVAGGGWTESILHSFTGAPGDGAIPKGNLILDANGNLFGTTSIGGIKNCPPINGCGTVFELSPGAGNWTENLLYEFANNGDGAQPEAGLVWDAHGNLYGTSSGILNASYGTVFELTPATDGGWTESTVYSFDITHGEYPFSNLIVDTAGNLYGTTTRGGDSSAYGTVFEITP